MIQSLTEFFAAWTTEDADSRRALIASAVGDEFYYLDPRTPEPITDIDGIDSYVANFLPMCPPGASVVVMDPVDRQGGHARATVAFVMSPDTRQTGQYFVDLDGADKITRLIGFVGNGVQ